MKHKLHKLLIALAFMAISVGAAAQEQIWNLSATEDDNVTATLVDSTLTISGTGNMKDYFMILHPAPFFGKAASIKNVIIEDGVTSIGNYAFWLCINLTEVTIGDGVKRIGEFVFYNCRSLISITIGDNVETIERDAFDECLGLTDITIPNSVTSIEDNVFEDCGNLAKVTIGNSVRRIGSYAFFNCLALTEITFLGDIPTIDYDIFTNIPANQVTLYYPCGNATWEGYTYEGVTVTALGFLNIIFDANNGSDLVERGCAGSVIPTPEDPTRIGYTFAGWYTDDESFADQWNFDTDVPVGDIKLYAKWSPVTYGITYELDGGNNHVANPEIYTIESDDITLGVPSRTDYTFVGWFDNALDGNEVEIIVSGSIGDTTLYARWTVLSSISTTERQQISLYPNPVETDGLFTIEIGQLEESDAIEIYSLNGALVATSQITGRKTTVNISHLPSGTYLVKVGSHTSKIVKL